MVKRKFLFLVIAMYIFGIASIVAYYHREETIGSIMVALSLASIFAACRHVE